MRQLTIQYARNYLLRNTVQHTPFRECLEARGIYSGADSLATCLLDKTSPTKNALEGLLLVVVTAVTDHDFFKLHTVDWDSRVVGPHLVCLEAKSIVDQDIRENVIIQRKLCCRVRQCCPLA